MKIRYHWSRYSLFLNFAVIAENSLSACLYVQLLSNSSFSNPIIHLKKQRTFKPRLGLISNVPPRFGPWIIPDVKPFDMKSRVGFVMRLSRP